MIKLIKGEWYRLLHTGHIFLFMIFTSMISIGLVFLINRDMLDRDLTFFAHQFAGIEQALMPITVAVLMPIAVAKMYTYKTGYYEVMDGSNTVLIILSKLIVYTIAGALIYLLPVAVFLIIIGAVNGIGEIDPPLYCLFFTLIMLRVIFNSVMFTMIIKGRAAAFLCYARYLFLEIAGTDMLILIFPDHAKLIGDIMSWFPMLQLTFMENMTEYDTTFILNVTVGFFAETALMFFWTYMNYKNKRFS